MEFLIKSFFGILEKIGFFIQWVGSFSPILGISALVIVIVLMKKIFKK